jgi:2-(1,2-epoxy-1,2-dihydrophenyl)acetyl-CoA isomerase
MMAEKYSSILAEKEDGVTIITLNRPEALNALDVQIRHEILEALDLATKDDTRVIILTGSGKAFCAGGDIKSWVDSSDEDNYERLDLLNEIIMKMINMDKPIISAVNGYAYGAGCNLALAADIIFASDDAIFCESFMNLGLIADGGGTYFLPRLIGTKKAMEIVLTADQISAAEAEKIGLINRVIPREGFDSEVKTFAKKLAQRSATAVGLLKKLMHGSFEKDIVTALNHELLAQNYCMRSEFHKDAVEAFLRKRK